MYLPTYTEFLNEQKEESFGSLFYEFDFPEGRIIQEKIDKKDLTGEGLCKEPRILLLGKIKSDEIDEKDVINFAKIDTAAEIFLKNISIIEEDKYDILKWDIDNSSIDKIKKSVKEIPHKNSSDPISVHSYIAYLKKGTAQKYIEPYEGRKFRIYLKYIVYKKANGIELKVSPK